VAVTWTDKDGFTGIDYPALRKDFPNLDIDLELGGMNGWLRAGKKRYTNWQRFVVNWLNRSSQNKQNADQSTDAMDTAYRSCTKNKMSLDDWDRVRRMIMGYWTNWRPGPDEARIYVWKLSTLSPNVLLGAIGELIEADFPGRRPDIGKIMIKYRLRIGKVFRDASHENCCVRCEQPYTAGQKEKDDLCVACVRLEQDEMKADLAIDIDKWSHKMGLMWAKMFPLERQREAPAPAVVIPVTAGALPGPGESGQQALDTDSPAFGLLPDSLGGEPLYLQ